jgi:hypothetical protein
MADNKYAKNIVTIPFRQTRDGALFSTGADILGGMSLNVIYACAYKTGITGLSTTPHVHGYDEAVYFIGSDPYHIDELGAEVEVSIGEPGKEEKHLFDKPTVLVAPKGLYHCPIVTRSIEKPYVCMAVSLTGKR